MMFIDEKPKEHYPNTQCCSHVADSAQKSFLEDRSYEL